MTIKYLCSFGHLFWCTQIIPQPECYFTVATGFPREMRTYGKMLWTFDIGQLWTLDIGQPAANWENWYRATRGHWTQLTPRTQEMYNPTSCKFSQVIITILKITK